MHGTTEVGEEALPARSGEIEPDLRPEMPCIAVWTDHGACGIKAPHSKDRH
jgi:hypothetical protein